MSSIDHFELAFLVHTAEMFNHYSPVWDKLNRQDFIIVVHGTELERQRTIEFCQQYQVYFVLLEDVLASGRKFPYLVSNHAMHILGEEPLIKAIGELNIRFMYALGKGAHNTSAWNHAYDLFLGFGPFHQQQLAPFKAPVVQMGYPRYDIFFNQPSELDTFKQQLPLDPGKQTLLWLPTWQELSTMDTFGMMMSTLMAQYNVIVKLHPLSIEVEPDRIARLMRYDFTAVITSVVDNVFLFALADKVVCDYGGTAFGAVYLDKPLLLLNLPDAEQDPLAGEQSPDITLRQHIINLNITEFHRIFDMLEDEDLWLEQARIRCQLRQLYFAPFYGCSADVAAKAIQHAQHIVSMMTLQDGQ